MREMTEEAMSMTENHRSDVVGEKVMRRAKTRGRETTDFVRRRRETGEGET